MHKKLSAILANSFLRDIAKLSFGTLGGRVIAIAALPLATRIYSPDDFALLAVYMALVNTITVAACLRFEIAIPLADDDDDAVNLLALALVALLVVSTLVFTVGLAIPATLAQWFGNPEIAPYMLLVPLGIAMAGSYAAFQFWATRSRCFGAIARTRIGQAGMGVIAMLLLGWMGIAPLGLLLGSALSTGAGGANLAFSSLKSDRSHLKNVSVKMMKAAFRKYYRYPMFSTPEALCNVAGIQVPMILIAAHGGSEAGFLLLSMQLMTAPMILLGGSISQVYMSRAPQELREGRLSIFTFSIMRRLAMIGAPPLIIVGIVAPLLFPWFFGPDWARSGEIVSWLVPWMVFQLIASPVSMVLYTVRRQNWALLLQFCGFIIRFGAVVIAVVFDPHWLVPAFAISSAAFYLIYIVVVIAAARLSPA